MDALRNPCKCWVRLFRFATVAIGKAGQNAGYLAAQMLAIADAGVGEGSGLGAEECRDVMVGPFVQSIFHSS